MLQAQYFKQQVEAYGFSAEIESYSVLLSSPVRRRVALVSPLNFECSLHEPSLSEDATSNETDIVASECSPFQFCSLVARWPLSMLIHLLGISLAHFCKLKQLFACGNINEGMRIMVRWKIFKPWNT